MAEGSADSFHHERADSNAGAHDGRAERAPTPAFSAGVSEHRQAKDERDSLEVGVIEEKAQTSEHSETDAESTRKAPLRESSSTFLASLSSASQKSSPLTSPFLSSDSLHNSEASRELEASKQYSQDNLSASGSTVELSSRFNFPDLTTSPTPSSSSASTRKPQLHENYDTPSLTVFKRPKSPAVKTSLNSTEGSNLSILPTDMSAAQTPSPSPSPLQSHAGLLASPPRNFLDTPRNESDQSLALSQHQKHDSEMEESYSKTPLLQPMNLPAPKETDQLVKDSSSMGNKLINEWEMIKKLGSGAHGTVKLGRSMHTGQKVAIKVVRRYPKKGRLGKHETPEDKVKKEVAVLKRARHPHVVSLLEVIDDPNYEKVYLILEFVERGEINWRRQTDKDIANFEMNRIRRELSGPVDEAAEAETLMHFNDFLLHRYLERAKSSPQESVPPGDFEGTAIVASHAEYEPVTFAARSRPASQPASRAASRPTSEYGDLHSPTHTLRVASRASHHGFEPYGNELSGSMWGSYVEDDTWTEASAAERRYLFDDSFTEAPEWTAEEEEYRYVPCLTLSEARDVFRDTVLGLEYLHYHGIIHRDIKPANLLWTQDYRVKISDFGVSYLGRPLSDEGSDKTDHDHVAQAAAVAKTVGTPAFYAPELCDPDLFDAQKFETRPHITGQIDVWALGVTLYAMIFGRLPFYDINEFAMYEKIAHNEVFIPLKRLRGVEDEGKIPGNSNKREAHVLVYEDVDDELRDLIKRLLVKDPTKRISIKEVKHHPWVLKGVSNHLHWIDATDPAYKGTRRIEVSQEDIQQAIAPRSFLDRFTMGIKRFTSVVRGRGDSRKRTESTVKNPSTSVGASSRSSGADQEWRRQSLRGDESIFSALRASRETADHPLSYSRLATPVHEEAPSEFIAPIPYEVEGQGSTASSQMLNRPIGSERTTSTAESILTIRPRTPAEPEITAVGSGTYLPLGSNSAASSSSSISKIIGGTKEATRRITSRVRSKDPQRPVRHDESEFSSRASSGDNIAMPVEDHHVRPTVAVSPAIAAGHMQPPLALTEEMPRSFTPLQPPDIRTQSPSNVEHEVGVERGRTTQARKRANTTGWTQQFPLINQPQTPRSRLASTSTEGHHASSSHHQFPYSLGPLPAWSMMPPPYASTYHPDNGEGNAGSLMTTGETITPALMKKYKEEQEKASKPKNEGDDDDESDDEGIVMG